MVLLALIYGGATVAAGLWAALIGEFHCSNVDCAGTDWTTSREGWQWDVLIALGLAGVVAGLATLVVILSARRPLAPATGLALQAAILVAVIAFLREAKHAQAIHVLYLSLIPVCGVALIYLRASRQIDGTRPE
jgi:hypothetical protein